MTLDPLLAITALDGRYRSKVQPLAEILSEYGLLHARVEVECRWFSALAAAGAVADLPALDQTQQAALNRIYQAFSVTDAAEIKTLERTTNHDVKAVEYFVKDSISGINGLASKIEFVHFACTSEDINNLSHALMLCRARDVLVPVMDRLIDEIDSLASDNADLAMLSRTHGQPASPTTLGKEMANVRERLRRQALGISAMQALGKMNGAVGNFNAHISAYPDADWQSISREFIEDLGLTCNTHTTQIEPHDYVAEWFHGFMRFNQVLLDFDRDIWSYISIDYFKQRKVEGETGSSTMPHKVNPIDFENSEGNLGLANALLDHMAGKLQVSRWQRDLSDSTVLRNIGAAFGHCLVAYEATLKGLSRLEVNGTEITADLMDRWEVLAEAVQTVMRRYGGEEPYEQLKKLTRGQQMDEALYREVLAGLQIPEAARAQLEALTPSTYIGLARDLSRNN